MLSNMIFPSVLLWQACALHNPVQDDNGNMLETGEQGEDLVQGNATSASKIPIANGLAGCKSGNFAAKGGDKCTGIQALRCNEDGGCVGTLQGNTYKINCNAKHECVTDSWGGTMVRKYFSTTGRVGTVDWNNGCSWVCENEKATRASKKKCSITVCARCYIDKDQKMGCGWSSKKGGWMYYDSGIYNTKFGAPIATGNFNNGDTKVKCDKAVDKATGLSNCAGCCINNKDYAAKCQCAKKDEEVSGSVDVDEGDGR